MPIPRQNALDAEARIEQRRDPPARGIQQVKGVEGDISAHAPQHKTGGSDPLTLGDIGGVPEHTHVHVLFILPSQDAHDAILDDWPHNTAGAANEVAFIWHVPPTWIGTSSISIVMIPDATETIQADIDVSIAAVGESYNADTRQALNQTLAVTVDQITEWNILDIGDLFSGVLVSGPIASDYVAIRFQSDTDTLRILGLRVNYSA